MVLKRKEGDLCSSYRPQTFSEVVGQKSIVKSLKTSIVSKNGSQCFLFHGESGTGKTTLARIIAMAVNCKDLRYNGDPCCECSNCVNISNDANPDVKEINAADTGGKDQIRAIQQDLKSRPMFGKAKVYILDEAHQMSSHAQEALLKGTEDMSDGIFIILCSTDPKKIKKTLRNRCEDYRFSTLSKNEMNELIETVSLFEGATLSTNVLNTIIFEAGGKARNALKILQKVLNIRDESESAIIELISGIDEADKNIMELCRLLIPGKKVEWSDIVNTYKKVNMEANTISVIISSYYTTYLKRAKTAGSSQDKVCLALEVFNKPIESIKPDNALIAMLYRVYKIIHCSQGKGLDFIYVKQ